MAKSRKTESTDTNNSEKQSTGSAKPGASRSRTTTKKPASSAKKPGSSAKRSASSAKKPVRRLKKDAAAATPTAPMVDTTLAAQNVARMLAAKAKLGKVPEAGVPDKESSLFKQLKESVSKPTAQLTSNVLGNTFGPQKSNLPVGNQGPVVRNQTQGAGRFNVPRRTVG